MPADPPLDPISNALAARALWERNPEMFFSLGQEPGTWSDGTPIHGLHVFVKLACGHHRVSVGWRGSAGESYHCDACRTMTLIMATIVTEEEPYGWRTPEEGQPERKEERDVGERNGPSA